jgi:dTMP kinase
MSGKFIVFDGLPGSGKGTMIKKTFEYLYDKSKDFDNILLTDEPTNGPYGKKVRELFKIQKSPDDLKEEIFKAFVDDRDWHIKEIIKPLLAKNFLIIGDRYKYSSIVYQTAQGNDFEKVFNAHKDFHSPDLIFILDLPPSVGKERMNTDSSTKRRETDNFREVEFISKLREGYINLPKQLPNENIKIIDASKSKEEVFNQIKKHLDELLDQQN